jgi:hypothetical protein
MASTNNIILLFVMFLYQIWKDTVDLISNGGMDWFCNSSVMHRIGQLPDGFCLAVSFYWAVSSILNYEW